MSDIYDLIIVGAGPAGLSAAIYMARAKYRVLVLEQEKIGGQITITSEVVNYPGVFETSGTALTQSMHKQAQKFGAEFSFAQVQEIDHSEPIKKIITNKGEFKALSVVLAVGANPRKLGFDGEQDFQGRGVAYCATCDGEFFTDKPVYVIGGGFAAVEEGVFLTKYASHVHMIVVTEEFTCAKTVAEKAINNDKITIHYQSEVQKVEGDNFLKSITVIDNTTKETRTITEDNGLGVFVFAGYVPNTKWLENTKIELNNGYIVTNEHGATNIDGIYAAGDVRIKELRQVVTAVSDGATAATSLEKYVEQLHKDLDLPEFVSNVPPQEPQEPQATVSGDFAKFQNNTFITADMAEQLQPVIAKMEHIVLLKTQIGSGVFGTELKTFITEVQQLTDKIRAEITEVSDEVSFVQLCHDNGTCANTRYRAVPTGHEFNSFLLGLLQISAEPKAIDDGLLQRIKQLAPKKLQVMITLTCTMCPEVVQACQRMAFENTGLETEVIDINHHLDIKDKYQIMSVPCLVVDGEHVHFGKKSLDDLVSLLEKE